MTQAIDAERALLGLLMLWPDRVWHLDLGRDDWSLDAHRDIHEALVELVAETGGCDMVSLAHRLERMGRLKEIGGRAYLTRLTEAAGTNHVELQSIIRDAARRRRLIRAGQLLVAAAKAPGAADYSQALDEVFAALTEQAGAKVKALHRLASDRVEALERREGHSVGVRTGFADLDRRIGGFPRGELTVLAARPGMGKSALAHQIAVNVAKRGDRVLLCSPEMSGESVANRVLAQASGENLQAIAAGAIPRDKVNALRAVAESLPVGVSVYDEGAMTTDDIIAAARAEHAMGGLALLIVDHLQYLADRPERGESRVLLVGRMVKRLKSLGRQIGCAVLLLSQLSRATEQRDNKRPMLSDLRDSGEIEQDADTVIMLYRPHVYDKRTDPHQVEVIIAKQRNGPTGQFDLYWRPESAKFEQYDHRFASAGGVF